MRDPPPLPERSHPIRSEPRTRSPRRPGLYAALVALAAALATLGVAGTLMLAR